jgi:hypothetical protein
MATAGAVLLGGSACLALVAWRLDPAGIAVVCLWILPLFSAYALLLAWGACRLPTLDPPKDTP